MRFLCALSLLASLASAQYVSQGWRPGQTPRAVPRGPAYDPSTPRQNPAPPVPAPSPSQDAHQEPEDEAAAITKKGPNYASGFWVDLFTNGPLSILANKTGINVTRVVERQHIDDAWDKRIPLIYDETFNETIVHEELTPEQEDERVWFLLVTGGPSGTSVGQWVDAEFDEAFNKSQIAGDVPHIHWARINYMDVTYITTRWSIWKAPVLVVATNRARTLRFFYPNTLNMRAATLYRFAQQEGWEEMPPWSGPYAPGGEREWFMEWLAWAFGWQFSFMERTPRMIMVLLTGGLTSLVVRLLHRGGGKEVSVKRVPVGQRQPGIPPEAAAALKAKLAEGATPPVSEPSASEGAKKKKSRKK